LIGNNLGIIYFEIRYAIGKIYQYVEPVNGVPQGNYEPVVRLVAPTKIQIATVVGNLIQTKKL
jgi:hypothetical protein